MIVSYKPHTRESIYISNSIFSLRHGFSFLHEIFFYLQCYVHSLKMYRFLVKEQFFYIPMAMCYPIIKDLMLLRQIL
jgi:hypothetical protein